MNMIKFKEKVNKKIYMVLFLICSVMLALPSIIYILKNKTIYKFVWVWTYFFRRPSTQKEKILNAILFCTIITLLFLLYMIIIKKHKAIFKSKKQIITSIVIISMIFLLIIPYTSTDVYSYIANGWSAAHYRENPYYTSTGEIADHYKVSDPMFNKVANCWRYETVVYGPVWTAICTGLSWISFGNIDIALLIFKLANLIIHLLNCLLIYKITKKNLFVVLYGLNPFILFEALSNVHNDIFIVFFILLAIYCIVKKKNLFTAVACIAIATAIKYFAILILPFIVIYTVRDKNVKERIKCCIYCGIEYVAILVLCYIVYLKDLNVLAGLLIQQGKYNRSIFYVLYEVLGKNTEILSKIQNIVLGIFAIYYIYVVIRLLFSKEIKLYQTIQKYHFILMIFTFILITNFNPWYIMWLYPTMFLLKGKSIKNILHLSYTGQIANIASFALHSEVQILGIPYFIIMTVGAIILNIIGNKTNWKPTLYIKKKKLEKETQK